MKSAQQILDERYRQKDRLHEYMLAGRVEVQSYYQNKGWQAYGKIYAPWNIGDEVKEYTVMRGSFKYPDGIPESFICKRCKKYTDPVDTPVLTGDEGQDLCVDCGIARYEASLARDQVACDDAYMIAMQSPCSEFDFI